MTDASSITQEELKTLFHYEPDAGAFVRLKSGFGKRAGTLAGKIRGDGYVMMSVNNMPVLAHRLAWFYMTGEWPIGIIDHIDRNRSNNCWDNLREANHRQNGYNCGAKKNNKTGFKGVVLLTRQKKCFEAAISINGKRKSIGTFYTAEEAAEAYNNFAKSLHGEFYFDARNAG